MNRTYRAILITLTLGVWFAGVSLWIKPEIVSAHRGMNSFELSDFRKAVVSVVLHCKASMHGGGKEHDAQIICYDKEGKFFGDWHMGGN